MAKYIFLTLPAYGHVNPTLAIVQELVNGESSHHPQVEWPMPTQVKRHLFDRQDRRDKRIFRLGRLWLLDITLTMRTAES